MLEDWYSCSSAHSQPLNANRKAYAAWWLWARLAGWSDCLDNVDNDGEDDVDGADLAAMASGFDGACLKAMADGFGAQ